MSPSEQAALGLYADALRRQQYAIHRSIYGAEDEKTEAEIDQQRTGLEVKAAQLPYQQEIAQINESLLPLQTRKALIDETSKLLQNQADIAKTAYDAQELAAKPAIQAAQQHEQAIQSVIRAQQAEYDQAVTRYVQDIAQQTGMTGREVRDILKKVGLTDSAADRAAATTDELARLHDIVADQNTARGYHVGATGYSPNGDLVAPDRRGGGSPVVVVHNTYDVDINNPHLPDEQSQQDLVDVLHTGLRESAAASTPLQPVGTEVH
jgi:hypothetical protein